MNGVRFNDSYIAPLAAAEQTAEKLPKRTAVKVFKIAEKHLFNLLLGFVSRGHIYGNIYTRFLQPAKIGSFGRLWQEDTKKPPTTNVAGGFWRRRWDLNPRDALTPYEISSHASSTT